MITGLDAKYINSEDYTVAFIDVLGVKNRVKKNLTETLESLWLINHYLLKEQSKNKQLIIRSFSDNYLLALKNDGANDASNFSLISNTVGNLANRCLRLYNILIRGAIVKGKLHIDNQIVLGPALIKAYQLESEVAIYPRIIIDDQILSNKFTSLSARNNDYTGGLFQDTDLLWCLNSLKFCNDLIEQTFRENLKNNIYQQIKEAQETKNERVLAKILWLKNYINSFYQQNYNILLIT